MCGRHGCVQGAVLCRASSHCPSTELQGEQRHRAWGLREALLKQPGGYAMFGGLLTMLAQAMPEFAVAPGSPARIKAVGLSCAHRLVPLAGFWLSLTAPTQSQSRARLGLSAAWGCAMGPGCGCCCALAPGSHTAQARCGVAEGTGGGCKVAVPCQLQAARGAVQPCRSRFCPLSLPGSLP